MTPTIGRIVHFTLNSGPHMGQVRPAIVVNVRDETTVDLQVFTDGTRLNGDCLPNMFWKPGARQGEPGEGGTWHWPLIIPPKCDTVGA